MGAKRLIEVLLITFVLMASIGLCGYYTLEVWRLDPDYAAPASIGFNLLLAFVLLRWYGARRAAEGAYTGPPVALGPSVPAPPRYTEAQQAYMNNPAARAACRHLQPVESLIRDRGIFAYPIYASALHADCRADEAELRRLLTLDPCVIYDEFVDDRDRNAALVCKECRYSIALRHPSLGGATLP